MSDLFKDNFLLKEKDHQSYILLTKNITSEKKYENISSIKKKYEMIDIFWFMG